MTTDTRKNTSAFFQNLLAGKRNGIGPADCGQHREHAEVALEIFQGKGAEGVRQILPNFPDELCALVCGEAEPETQPAAFKFLSLEQLLGEPDKRYLVEGVLGEGDLAMIYGAPGSGKSFVILNLLVSAALGETWAGKHKISKSCKVCYSTGEGWSGIKGRFAAAVGRHTKARPDAMDAVSENLIIARDVPQLFEENSVQSAQVFAQELRQQGHTTLDILVIDTLATASLGADENAAKDMGRVVAAAKYLQHELHCAVIIVHHANKTGNYRGSSTLHGALDLMISVKHGEGLKWIECEKSKDAEPFKPLYFDIISEPVSRSAYLGWQVPVAAPQKKTAKQKIGEFLREQTGQKVTTKQIGEHIQVNQSTVNKFAGELVDEGKVQRNLQNPDKKPSNRNPTVYWIDAE